MKIPYVTTFCGLFSVHMGALLIVYINNFVAFLAFVSWITNAFAINQRLRHNHANSENENPILACTTIAFGIILVGLHAYMAILISIGLQKDDPRYLNNYMRMGYVVLFMNTCNSVMAFFGHDTFYISLSGLISVPLQCYFMLVIRSTIKEMIEERSELSSSRNHPI